LVENGFQRQEVDEMLTPPPMPDLGPLFSVGAATGEIIVVPVDQMPDITRIPIEAAKGVRYDARTHTLELPANSPDETVHIIADAFSDTVDREKFIQTVTYKKTQKKRTRLAPSERGEVFSVPVLAFRQGKLLEQFEENHFLDQEWSLDSKNANLSIEEFSAESPGPRQAEVDITEDGKIRTSFLDDLQQAMTLLKVDTGWKVADLVFWLDRSIHHPDITAVESGTFITRLIMNLIEQRKIPLETLVREKYRLKEALAKKIDQYRQNAHVFAFSQLLQAPSPLEVTPDLVFTYNPEEYPAPVNSLYRGMHSFRKHYYPDVGDLKSSGEEHECAQFIDSLEEVDCWVRNIDSNPTLSFWLQTSKYKFYPDFVCKLKDERYLVVEYKGGHLYTDAEEKRIIGDLWELRSNRKCLFVMPTNRNFAVIHAKVKGK